MLGNQAINARVETAATKPLFRCAWKDRRCLVPASGFYEWKELPSSMTKSRPLKQPFYITRKDGLPLTFAGGEMEGRHAVLHHPHDRGL
jgi:putative SOS response-associated peptidase YedK